MAEEEVDWGMDESMDVWRQGGNVAAGEDEDAISLDGMEGDVDALKPFSKPSVSPRRASISRPPPTGPRKPLRRPDGPATEGSTPPTGPKRTEEREGPRERGSGDKGAESRSVSATTATGSAGAREGKNGGTGTGTGTITTPEEASTSNGKPATTTKETSQARPTGTETKPALEPLPEGWTEIVSRSSGGVFYHNKITSEASWTRPRASPPKQDPGSNRPATPPPTPAAAAVTVNGNKIVTPVKTSDPVPAPAATAPASGDQTDSAVRKVEKQPPTGPSGGRFSDTGSAPRSAEKKADTNSDTVQSAYANRRTATRGRDGRGPPPGPGVRSDDRGVKRSPSPRSEEPKRLRMDDARLDSFRDQARDTRPPPPSGPRSLGPAGSGPRSPPRFRQDDRGPRGNARDAPRFDDRGPPRSQPRHEPPRSLGPPQFARGPNTAPISASRWSSRPNSNSPMPTPSSDRPQPPFEARDAPRPIPSRMSSTTADDASIARARLREEAKKAEEILRKIKEEEQRLEREEQDKKRNADVIRRKEAERRREDERREMEAARDRRPRSPQRNNRLQYEDRSYRPAASPPRAPPPVSRMNGPGPPQLLRDARRTRPDSPSRITRRTSPAPMQPMSLAAAPMAPRDSRDRGDRYGPRATSPSRRSGDSHYPDVQDGGRDRDRDRDRLPPPLVDRIGRSRGQPEMFVEPMRARLRSPPLTSRPLINRGGDLYRPNDSPPVAPAHRPLAERMSRDVRDSRDDRGMRDRGMRDDLAARRM